MKLLTYITAGALVVAAVPAQAGVTLLQCELINTDGSKLHMDVQLNEQSGWVNHSNPKNGNKVAIRGIFSPTEVTFDSFVIDRITLEFQRINSPLYQRVMKINPVEYGQCEVDDRKRAF